MVQIPNYYYLFLMLVLLISSRDFYFFVSTVKYKMYNVSNHGVIDIVLKDFKKWTKGRDLTFGLSPSCIFT